MKGSALSITGLLAGLLFGLPAIANAFDFENVAAQAEVLAQKDYKAPPLAPEFLRALKYPDYQTIRFKPEASIWRLGRSQFQVMMIPQGSFYSHAVKLNVIDSEGVHPLEFDKTVFDYPNPELAKRIPADLGYAGFKLTFPLAGKNIQNQFLVFGGASYFRAVGAGQRFGLSGRGVAVDTGLPSGEEFPSFTEFWLERPAAGSDTMVVYGLLDGPSLTGAYRFVIRPGASTRMQVTAQLFFRNDIRQLGLAPLTSMFYYGDNTIRPRGEWRPQVHDSDGLLVHDGASGEWLWRPLLNPSQLQLSFHQVKQLAGFGLVQRDQKFHQFEDSEARYDLRPSAWVQPKDNWGAGSVVLVEIPTNAESNDNIVAFWKSDQAVKAGEQRRFEYALAFGRPEVTGHPSGRTMQTFLGDGNRPGGGEGAGAYRFIVDFQGKPLDGLRPDAAVVSQVTGGEGVEVIEHFVEYIEASNVWRLSILARPDVAKPLTLRGFLSLDDQPLTETWTYSLAPSTGLRANPE
ncbi:glucan biosynthesis protein G [Marinobacter subterrani]|uniref:Glucans biosynthesis protein G n=1 Tax=Marinobacter subterrani TaxID=1658765 RepID=A0A0J7J8Z7_9GAMM|nr:glucan biosynthesis protein G [Marinobacter subterrani]KMQ74647.1 Periplasmic glucans biosynthesis protein [Marinobacter subterrani]